MMTYAEKVKSWLCNGDFQPAHVRSERPPIRLNYNLYASSRFLERNQNNILAESMKKRAARAAKKYALLCFNEFKDSKLGKRYYRDLRREERIRRTFARPLVKKEPVIQFKVDFAVDIVHSLSKSPKQHKVKCIIPESGPFRTTVAIDEPWELVRNPTLLEKLRERIRDIRNGITHEEYWKYMTKPSGVVEPQMEGVKGEELIKEITSNVVLTEENPASSGITAIQPEKLEWHTLSSTEFTLDYELLLNRNTYFKTFSWRTSQNKDTRIEAGCAKLPTDFISTGKNDGSTPIFIPFKIHRYWRGDIVIKVHINSNKFQTGQLQCSWNYLREYDAAPLNTIYEMCQLPHIIVNAGASNEAELRIPYKHVRPYLHTKARKGYVEPLYLGTFNVEVLVPLRTSSTGPKECNVTLFVRFENNSFTGLLDGNIVEPQMMAPVAMMAACRIIDKVVGDTNCDNNISTETPKYLVPTATHSWSIGNGTNENIHNLRLFNSNRGVGRTQELDTSDLLIKTPVSVFGMLRHIDWDADSKDNNKSGKCIWSMDVHPQCDKDKLYKFEQSNYLNSYCMPPVGVISSLFMYWRGSLEFKFDVVASQFHTGRLLVAYVPGMHNDKGCNVTLEQARNSAHAVFTLQDSASFTVSVPFIADKPWWHKKYGGPQRRTEFAAPSRLYLFIVNPLVKMESVSKVVTIVPYVRAGADFELAVPVQPSIGTSFNRSNLILDKYYLRAVDGYYPYYVGAWHSFESSSKAILRYGPGSDHVAQFVFNLPSLKETECVYYEGDVSLLPPIGLSDGTYIQSKYIVPYVSGGYVYGVPFPDDDGGLLRAKTASTALKRNDYASFISNVYDIYGENSSLMGKGNPKLKPVIYIMAPKVKRDVVSEFEIVQPEMEDERICSINSLIPTSYLQTTNSGMLTFGEPYTDLKDLLRRYHLYWEGVIPLNNRISKSEAFMRFPVLPGGLDLDLSVPSSHWNYLRDGVLGLINSGYFFFRGSMRFKVIFPASINCNIWVQHHPDMPNNLGRVVTTYPNIQDSDRFKNHAYAMYIQSTFINNTLEFEVPFYQPGMYGISRFTNATSDRLDLNDYTGLGDIVLGFENECFFTPVPVSVYASVADDFSLSTFRGFNAVVMCDETFTRVEQQMMDALMGSLFGTAVSKLATTSINDVKQSMRSTIRNEVCSAIKPSVDNIASTIKQVTGDVSEETSNWCKNQALITAFGNLMHILMNPSIKTIALAVSNILASFIIGSVNILSSFNNVLVKFFSNAWQLFDGNSACNRVEPQMDSTMDKSCMAVLSVFFTAVAATVGYCKSDKPGAYFNLMKNVNITTTLSNNIIMFIRNCNEAIVYFYQWVLIRINPRATLEHLLDNSTPDIKDWYKECTYLLDSRLKPRLTYEKQLISRVFDACVFGSIMILNGIDDKTKGGKILTDMYKEICKLRNDLIERGAHPDVRFECYPIWFSGPAGIGKSFLTTQFVNDLLRSIKYAGSGSLIYYLIPGLKHWSGVQNPAALVSDDIFQVEGQKMEEELANLFSICSSSVLNPPMAAIADKERRLNPLLYIMHCNYSFPDISVMRCADAVYRRRKQLIEVELTDEIKSKYPNFIDASILTPEETKDFKHLKFRLAVNPKIYTTGFTAWMNYIDLMKIITPKFVDHYERERSNFKQRMCDMYSLDPMFNQMDLFEEIPTLKDTIGLKEQIRLFKDRVKTELSRLDDPVDESELPFLEKLQRRVADFKNRYFSPEMESDSTAMHSDILDKEIITITMEEFYSEWMWACSHISPDFAVELNRNLDLTSIDCDDILKLSINARKISDSYKYDAHSILGRNKDAEFILPAANCSQQVKMSFDFRIAASTVFDTRTLFKGAATIPDRVLYINTVEGLSQYLRGIIHAYTERARLEMLRDKDRVGKAYDISEDATRYMEAAISVLANDPQYKDKPETINATSVELSTIIDAVFGDLILCSHGRFWFDALNDMKNVTYCDRKKLYFYKNCLGITTSSPAKCECARSPVNNKLFAYYIQYIYSAVHESEIELEVRERPTNILAKTKQYVLDLWFESIVPTVKCWWRHYVCPAVAYILDFIVLHLPKILITIVSIIAALGLQWAGTRIGEAFMAAPDECKFENQGANYFKFEQPKAHNKTAQQPQERVFSQSSPQQRSHLARRIENNTVLIHATWIQENHRMVRQCRCLMLYGRKMLVLRHYMEEYAEIVRLFPNTTFKLFFNVSGKASNIELHFKELFADIVWASVGGRYDHTNFGVVCLPKHVVQFKNILPLIATRSQHDKVASVCDIYALGDAVSYDLPLEEKRKFIVAGTNNSSEIILDKVYSYMRQDKGLCGSVIVSNNINSGAGAIIGIHVGGNPSTGMGIAEPIYREALETLYEMRPDREVMEVPVNDVAEANIELDTNLLVYGCVPPQFAHKESGKTKIVPSLLHGVVYPVRTEVNPLKPNDPRQPPGSHPLRDGCNKHGTGDVRPFDPDIVSLVRTGLSEKLNQIIKPVRATIQPLTLQQAVCGDVDIPYFESLNWKSSEGFPLVNARPKTSHDKRWLFDLEEGLFGYKLKSINSKLEMQLKLRDECFRKNIKPPTIYIDCLKDYRLSPEKCKEPGKTRIFSIAPVQCSIDIRMYMNDFCAGLKNSRIKNMIGIGINPDSIEWTQLVQYLHEVGNNIITLDYKNYGPCLMSQLVAASSDLITSWFKFHGATEEHVRRVDWLLDCDILNPVHLTDNVINQTINGISSGSPLTGECNSIPNIFYIMLCFVILMQRHMPEYASTFYFFAFVRLVVYGDDLIMSVDDTIRDLFNAITIKSTLLEHGIRVTSADKSSDMVPYSTIHSATFLKRGFVEHPRRSGIWLAPVEKQSVEECINWVHVNDDPYQAQLEVCRASMDLAYGHGPAYYDQHKNKILKHLSKVNGVIDVKTWTERDNEIFGSTRLLDTEATDFLKLKVPWIYKPSEM